MRTDVLTVAPETSVADVVQLLAELDATCAVVVGADGRAQGIVSERDLLALARSSDERLSAMLRRMLQEEHHIFDSMRELRKAAATHIADIATVPVACAGADMTVPEMAAIMEQRDVRQLPVVRDGRVVGVVTRKEIVRAIADQA